MDAEDDGVSGRWISKNGSAKELMDKELATLLEDSVEALPESYRLVFVLREVEKMDTRETAECLGLSEESIKVRLHRARALMRRELTARAGPALSAGLPVPPLALRSSCRGSHGPHPERTRGRQNRIKSG